MAKSADRRRTLGRVLRYMGPYRLHLCGALLLALISVALQLYIPILV